MCTQLSVGCRVPTVVHYTQNYFVSRLFLFLIIIIQHRFRKEDQLFFSGERVRKHLPDPRFIIIIIIIIMFLKG